MLESLYSADRAAVAVPWYPDGDPDVLRDRPTNRSAGCAATRACAHSFF
jgi:hypothetical protein